MSQEAGNSEWDRRHRGVLTQLLGRGNADGDVTMVTADERIRVSDRVKRELDRLRLEGERQRHRGKRTRTALLV